MKGDGPAENLPAWLIFDQTYRDRYLFAGVTARTPRSKSWMRSGAVKRAPTLDEIAAAIEVPAGARSSTINRFNDFARTGKDLDFGRGESAYDRYYGDTTNKPNASLGPIIKPPFYAAQIVPSDLGTKGGIDTDTAGRALRADGSLVEGLLPQATPAAR